MDIKAFNDWKYRSCKYDSPCKIHNNPENVFSHVDLFY